MSQKLVSLNQDLSRLRSEGYDVSIKADHLVIKDVPFVNSQREIKRGILVSVLDIAGGKTLMPETHVIFFVGDYPCDTKGAPLPGVSQNTNQQILPEFLPNHQVSRKRTIGRYQDYYEKMTTLIEIVMSPALAIDPTVTAKTHPVVVPDEGDSVFNYIDTAATKAGIVLANQKLESGKIAIVGVGGTGSYVFDLIAKTPVEEIHLFDGDHFYNHNAFRSPGAPSNDELGQKLKKVAYFQQLYSKMRKGIVAHDAFLDESNIDQLRNMGFVFLCIDRGAAKPLIVEKLEEWGIPFIDVGMGIQLGEDNSLGGILTVTSSTPEKRDHFRTRVALSDGEAQNEYSNNIQIADLSALNATLAVIKWKKLRGYYQDYMREHFCAYSINANQLDSKDMA